jgi:hypothetical protein
MLSEGAPSPAVLLLRYSFHVGGEQGAFGSAAIYCPFEARTRNMQAAEELSSSESSDNKCNYMYGRHEMCKRICHSQGGEESFHAGFML